MTIGEVVNKIDKSKENEGTIDTEDLCYELDLPEDYFEAEELKCYWIANWQGSDSDIGAKIYFLNNEPVCYSYQRGRKSKGNYFWFSKECAKKTREFIREKIEENNTLFEEIELMDFTEKFSDSSFYTISYNSCVINWNNIYHQGEKVEFIEKVVEDKMDTIIGDKIVIKTPSGELKTVSLRGDILFKLHIND